MKQEIIYSDNMCQAKGIPSLPDESVHLCFYSPPYYNYVDYEGGNGIGKKTDTYEAYLESMKDVHLALWEKVVPGGRLIVNATNVNSRLKVEGYSFMYPIAIDLMKSLGEVGFTFYDDLIWNKKMGANRGSTGTFLYGSYPYPPTPKILNASFENLYIFIKEGKRKVPKEIKELSKLTAKEWNLFTHGIWEIPPDRERLHPATFPLELAERVIRLYSFVGDTVLDPFVGSGTTMIACEKWDRNGLGYEISESYRESYENRRTKYIGQLEMNYAEAV